MVCSFNRKLNSNEKNCFYLRQHKESCKPNILKNKPDTKAKQNKNKKQPYYMAPFIKARNEQK